MIVGENLGSQVGEGRLIFGVLAYKWKRGSSHAVIEDLIDSTYSVTRKLVKIGREKSDNLLLYCSTVNRIEYRAVFMNYSER